MIHVLNKPETSVISMLGKRLLAREVSIFNRTEPFPHLYRWEASYSTDRLHHHEANCIHGWWQNE